MSDQIPSVFVFVPTDEALVEVLHSLLIVLLDRYFNFWYGV